MHEMNILTIFTFYNFHIMKEEKGIYVGNVQPLWQHILPKPLFYHS